MNSGARAVFVAYLFSHAWSCSTIGVFLVNICMCSSYALGSYFSIFWRFLIGSSVAPSALFLAGVSFLMFLALSLASQMQSRGVCSGGFSFFCAIIFGALLDLECLTWVLPRGEVSSSCRISGYCAWVEEILGYDTWRGWIFLVLGTCLGYQWWARPRIFLPWYGLPHSMVPVDLSWRFF